MVDTADRWREINAAGTAWKTVSGDDIDLSSAFGLWYAMDFLEKGSEEAGRVAAIGYGQERRVEQSER